MTERFDYFDLNSISYPALIVVYGPSRGYVTTHRGENDEHFSIQVCKSNNEAYRLLEGYGGHPSELKVWAVPDPYLVVEICSKGYSTEYDKSWSESDG